MQALSRAASPDVGIRYCCAVAKHRVLIEMNCFDAAKQSQRMVNVTVSFIVLNSNVSLLCTKPD